LVKSKCDVLIELMAYVPDDATVHEVRTKATDRGSNRERKSADGDGGDGDKRTPDEGRSGGGETRRDAGVMPVHEWWTTGEESEKAEEDG
jgi:hypothetical protein